MSVSIEPAFDRAVARHLVHRWAVSEVYLTQVAAEPGGYTAAAQLPAANTYFGDLAAPTGVDTVLLMECARQAATCIAHEHLGVPYGSMFLVADWTFDVPGELLAGDAVPHLHGPAYRPDTGRLTMHVTVAAQQRSGVTRGARFDVRLTLDGVPAGTMTVSARYTPREEAELVRRYHRRTAPTWSTDLPARPAGTPVPARVVGRTRTDNVVLFDAGITTDTVRARLGTVPAHRGFYDHPQDHYPAMILVEAAGQAATLLTGERIAGYRAVFTRFAEFDTPVLITAARVAPGQVHVTFTQAGEAVVAEIVVPVAAQGGRR